MILVPKHRVVWKGNHWSDIVFTAINSFVVPTSYVGFRVYLELTEASEGRKEFVPCGSMDFSGRPNFHFLSRYPTSFLGDNFTEELSSVCSFLFNNRCLVGARVHHDVLNDNFVSFKLVVLVATKLDKTFSGEIDSQPAVVDNDNDFVSRFRFDSSKNAKVPIGDVQILTCRSEEIKIAEYKLSVQEKFSISEYTLHRKDISPETFEWYNKNGGDMVSIDVVIHLRDIKGAIVYDYPKMLRVKTELVYDTGKAAPLYPLVPLKAKGALRKKDNTKMNKLFNPTRPEPVLGKGQGSQYFSFRIEEVSAHHQNCGGFKLKVSPMDPTCSDVYYGVMEETIIVKSKPKTPMKRRGKGGRSSILQKAECLYDAETMKNEEVETKKKKRKKARKVSVEDISQSSAYDKDNNTITMKSSMITALFAGCGGSKCLSCGEELKSGSGLCPSHHKLDCRFNMTLSPYAISAPEGSLASMAAPMKLEDYQNGIIDFAPDEAAESLLALSSKNSVEI